MLANWGWNATPRSPRSPLAEVETVTNGVGSSAPFFTTRRAPPCWAMKSRPSGLHAIVVASPPSPDTKVVRLKPVGRELPLKVTRAADQGERFPAASRAWARTTWTPLA